LARLSPVRREFCSAQIQNINWAVTIADRHRNEDSSRLFPSGTGINAQNFFFIFVDQIFTTLAERLFTNLLM
jgi:hypothetical protein